MTGLLRSHEGGGYPTEYLLSRIRGRRSSLVRDWNAVLLSRDPLEYALSTHYGQILTEYSHEGVWRRLLDEYAWAYTQMNDGLRKVFTPFFAHMEVRTLIVCLRLKLKKGTVSQIADLLAFSLLTDSIKQILMVEREMPAVMDLLRAEFPSMGADGDMQGFSLEKGLRNAEEKLAEVFFAETLQSDLHPFMRDFLTGLVDYRNILTLAKCLRWNVRERPAFLAGGGIPVPHLEKAFLAPDSFAADALLHRLTGLEVTGTDAPRIERALKAGLTRKIRLLARENSSVGRILEYLWACWIEAGNLSAILRGTHVPEEILKGELVIQ